MLKCRLRSDAEPQPPIMERVYLRVTQRSANGVATRLARYALHSQRVAEWVTDPPDFLQDVLFIDVM
ncbi:hypothetical protein L3X38_043171 [Prunus dulcis]|uniref:Uncharacterized protein n=1 Tax=Prunus dulcis TaxID=3755 RepID=A0AAD4UVY7_PRUDU|nr:hypothetical protein L3X38_043171 [Prunus dulcis]